MDSDLRLARAAIDRIPGRDRLAVLAAHDLFAELNVRLRAAGAAGVLRRTDGEVHVVIGAGVQRLAREMEKLAQ